MAKKGKGKKMSAATKAYLRSLKTGGAAKAANVKRRAKAIATSTRRRVTEIGPGGLTWLGFGGSLVQVVFGVRAIPGIGNPQTLGVLQGGMQAGWQGAVKELSVAAVGYSPPGLAGGDGSWQPRIAVATAAPLLAGAAGEVIVRKFLVSKSSPIRRIPLVGRFVGGVVDELHRMKHALVGGRSRHG